MQAGAEGAGPGAGHRDQHPAAVRGAAERHPRRRRPRRRDEVLLHPQAHADQGVARPSCACPGGFGTQDETFELLTLLQTGKAAPAPVVLLDVPGGTYWTRWVDYLDTELVARRPDLAGGPRALPRHRRRRRGGAPRSSASGTATTRSAGSATASSIRLRHAPTDEEVAELNERFADLLRRRRASSASDPLPAEVADRDDLDLPRLVMRYDARRAGRLRGLIDALNDLPSATARRERRALSRASRRRARAGCRSPSPPRGGRAPAGARRPAARRRRRRCSP